MSDIKLIYFSLINPNTRGNTNLKHWQDLFKGRILSKDVPNYIRDAQTATDYQNLSKEERKMAEAISKMRAIQMAELSTATRIGREKGREEGREKGRAETALRALEMGLDKEFVSKITGLSIEEIEKLKESAKKICTN